MILCRAAAAAEALHRGAERSGHLERRPSDREIGADETEPTMAIDDQRLVAVIDQSQRSPMRSIEPRWRHFGNGTGKS